MVRETWAPSRRPRCGCGGASRVGELVSVRHPGPRRCGFICPLAARQVGMTLYRTERQRKAGVWYGQQLLSDVELGPSGRAARRRHTASRGEEHPTAHRLPAVKRHRPHPFRPRGGKETDDAHAIPMRGGKAVFVRPQRRTVSEKASGT
jgi:hypothetical protein